jgi:hypothetical protein
MAKFIVIGNKNAYIMESTDIRTAWDCAEKELKYGYSGNIKVETVIKK